MSRSALVRDDLGGLSVRRFASAADAAAIARDLAEVPDIEAGEPTARKSMGAMKVKPAMGRNRSKGWTPAQLARLLGVSKRTINRRCEADLLPFIDHGTPEHPRRVIAPEVVRLVRLRGLGGVAAMRRNGLL